MRRKAVQKGGGVFKKGLDYWALKVFIDSIILIRISL
jgi:hypothetical protein